MRQILFLSTIFVFLSGCLQMDTQHYYRIDGFCVLPIKQICVEDGQKIVRYITPNRIKLSELP
jgi:hypothetical protein